MPGSELRIDAEKLALWMVDAFTAQGASREDAEICSDVLMAADLRGIDTHGLSRMKYYADRIEGGVTRTSVDIETVKETTSTAVLDGRHSLGHVVAYRAMEMAINKARQSGLGAVAVRNSTHYGIAGYFAEMAVKHDMIGLATTNARPCVVPTHGLDPKFGTNPLAFAAPSDEAFPFLFDASLATVQRGKLEIAARQGKPMPDGFVVDDQGCFIHDARQALELFKTGKAALVPLGGKGEETGGHKGFGISIMLEILSSALQGGAFLSGLAGGDAQGTWEPYRIGHFFMAISVEAFTDPSAFRTSVGDIMRELRASRLEAGQPRVWTPGEKEFETERERRELGIPVTAALAKEASALTQKLGLDQWRGLFASEQA